MNLESKAEYEGILPTTSANEYLSSPRFCLVDPYYSNSRAFEKNAIHSISSQNQDSHAHSPLQQASTGLGLTYQKFRTSDPLEYESHLISTPIETFASAPAAFPAYHDSHSATEEYGDSYNTMPMSHSNQRTFTSVTAYNQFEGYFYQQQGEPQPGEWMPQPYPVEPPFEYDTYMPQNATHVNPAALLDASFQSSPQVNESGQTVSNFADQSEYTTINLKHKPALSKDPTRISRSSSGAGAGTGSSRSTTKSVDTDDCHDRKTLKRLRNRVSASRCREKKKEWITEMKDESLALEMNNRALIRKATIMEESIRQLRKLMA